MDTCLPAIIVQDGVVVRLRNFRFLVSPSEVERFVALGHDAQLLLYRHDGNVFGRADANPLDLDTRKAPTLEVQLTFPPETSEEVRVARACVGRSAALKGFAPVEAWAMVCGMRWARTK